MSVGLHFLGWARQGLVAGHTTPDTLTTPLPADGTIEAAVRVNQRPEKGVKVRLYGPGDVTGIDPRQVIRTDPVPGATEVEPNLFPLIEFDRHDLPWLLTPAGANANRLRPWLCLVVVEADASSVDFDPAMPRPKLTCRQGELPDLRESWAWAHAQVLTARDDETLLGVIAAQPERTLSRLICPRRLKEGTRYRACLVPAFEPGRKAGLGLPFDARDAGELRPAWQYAPGLPTPYELPVYHHWEFTTGQAGDFETLVRRLAARVLPPSVGLRDMDVRHPGGGLPDLPPTAVTRALGLEGALRASASRPTLWDAGEQAEFARRLRPLLAERSGRVAPPTYGSLHAAATGPDGRPVLPPDGQASWLRELNLDPRHRAAAAFGAAVVREQQEHLMASAWTQAAEIERVNEALRQGRLAREVSVRMYERRILGGPATLAAGAAIPDDQLLQMTAAAHPDITLTPRATRTVAGAVGAEPAVNAATSVAFRRLTRPRGPLARRVLAGEVGAPTPLAPIAGGVAPVTPPVRPPGGTVLLDEVSGGTVRWKGLTPALLAKADAWWSPPAPAALTTSAALVGDETPSTVLYGPGAALTGDRIWVGSADGRLFERRRENGAWRWVDHGRPETPGTWYRYRVTTAPGAAMSGRRVFVGAEGRLFQRYWDGDRWVWIDHGRPPGTGVAMAPGAPMGDNRVWITGGNGQLYELRRSGDTWTWVAHGAPPNDWVASAPVAAFGDSKLFVGSGYGRLFERYRQSGETWAWTDHGMPWIAQSNTKMEPGADLLGAKLFVRIGTMKVKLLVTTLTRGPAVFQRLWNGSTWQWQDHATPTGAVPTGVPGAPMQDRKMFVPDEDGNVWELYWNDSAWVWLPHGMPDNRPVAQIAERPLDGQTFFVATRDGYLYERFDTGNGWLWRNHGQPVAVQGGRGGPSDQPVADARWEPPIGYLSNLVALHVNAPDGPNRAYLRVGRNLDFGGTVAGTWGAPTPLGWGTGAENQGAGIAIADISGNGRPDLLLFWISEQAGPNTGHYQIGWDIDANGVPTAGWSDVKGLPEPIADQIQGADVTLADIDGDGRPELVLAYVTGGQNRIYYRVGWSLSTAGVVSRGWSPSMEVPGDPGTVDGVGVAVADLTGDRKPDLLVFTIEDAGGPNRGVYRIGRSLNARGNVVGGWAGPHLVGGEPFGSADSGAGVAVVDVNGNGTPDLVIFHVEDRPGENVGWYRVGWDLGTTGTTARWSPNRPVPGWYGANGQGAALAVADIDPALLDTRNRTGNNFRTAASRHQGHLVAQQKLVPPPAEPVNVPLAPLAQRVREAIDPAGHVEARVSARVTVPGGSLDATPGDTLRPLITAPRFPQPMYELLRDMSQDLLLPGVEQVPAETVTLLRGNPAFIESFMVGLNHEMSRELAWREFPADRRATYFRQFWDVRDSGGGGLPLTDVPPIAEWHADQALGRNATAVGGADMLVLLLRGELLRRYPTATIYARRARWADAAHTRRDLADEERRPLFRGTMRPDLTFFGFGLTVSDARGTGDDPGWFFVIQEQPTAPRFGLDELPEPPRPPGHGTRPASWADLHWGQMAANRAGYDALTHAPVAAPFGGLRIGALTWAQTSAHLAHITLQRPMQVAIHATDMLPAVQDGNRVTHVARANGGSGAIVALGGVGPEGNRWRMTEAEVIAALRRGEPFHVEEPAGDRVRLIVSRTHAGRPYAKTEADGDEPNNLLALPHLPEEQR
ncbi:FG-GAP-like repeat-containing protein [Micromonospora costi]|uniref:DUF3892 domain-containing protein n=1 Tax=Micromonospora costi TaxID=1530042 RepID=A0A3A9ZW60_9ACTN|nr:FG-GAP-like repeat-containing protein [Micromonospora costi]RKN52094.1 DUF3892 domain-containing protein [Micromonospora costi]